MTRRSSCRARRTRRRSRCRARATAHSSIPRTQFAAVTQGGPLDAVHAVNSNPGDARYGLRLVAAELDTVTGWRSVLPQRPLTRNAIVGGLAMLSRRTRFYPVGRRTAPRAAHRHDLRSLDTGRDIVDRGTQWTFSPTAAGEGVMLSFTAEPRSATRSSLVRGRCPACTLASGVTVDEPDGSIQAYLLNVPVTYRLRTPPARPTPQPSQPGHDDPPHPGRSPDHLHDAARGHGADVGRHRPERVSGPSGQTGSTVIAARAAARARAGVWVDLDVVLWQRLSRLAGAARAMLDR